MIALEKLLLLKSVTLFKQTPVDLLMQVVITIVKEQMFSAGERIIEKGDSGTNMFIIVKGQVKVHDGETIIATLSDREIFGELSALSLQPRVASVSAVTDCVLLKISSAGLYEIMHLDIGLAKGIIHALCDRARSMSMQMQELRKAQ